VSIIHKDVSHRPIEPVTATSICYQIPKRLSLFFSKEGMWYGDEGDGEAGEAGEDKGIIVETLHATSGT
jgi:hypothetical protein